MPLIVPALRILFTFLNVFETFKTLKMPPPSSRNGGNPTVRAMSQRKRSMKGCLTVWLVWCCFMLYERTVDSIIGMFIPFYNEFKSLVILFLLLTRARSAEPIFLHVIRPLIKPYVTTLDALLYITHQAGDLVILVASIPIEFVVSRYRYWFGYPTPPAEVLSETQSQRKSVPSERPGPRRVDTTEYGATRSRRHALDNAHVKASSSRPDPSAASGSSQTRQVWHPPPSAYEREGLPTPPYEDSDPVEQQPEAQTDLEWRKYEPFPSAYPPTPLVNTASLPPTNHEPMDGIEEEEGEPGEVEEWRKYEDFPSAYPATPLPKRKQLPQEIPKLGHVQEESEEHELEIDGESNKRRPGFHRSLKQTHESMNPRHAGSLGDNKENKSGVRRFLDSDGEMNMDVEDEDEGGDADDSMYMDEEEDSFDVTLRTPFPLSKRENLSHFSTTSNDDGPGASTGLSTVDNGSPFRTRVNSEVPPAPLAGTKRPYTGVDGEDLAARVRRLENMRTAASKVQRLQVPQTKTRTPHQGPTRLRRDSHGSTRDSEDDASSSSINKKRRVGLTKEASSGREERKRPESLSVPKPTVTGTRVRRATAASVSRVSSGSSASSRTDLEPRPNPPKVFLRKPVDKPLPKHTPPTRTSRTAKPVKHASPY